MTLLARLQRERILACRLTSDRGLQTFDEAREFLLDRGLLTLTPDCALPSLFGACHEEPYKPGGRGFGSWPRTKYPWSFALARQDGVLWTRLHRGKGLFLAPATGRIVDPLCRAAVADALAGKYGQDGALLARHLGDAGPSALDEIKEELGWSAQRLRFARERTERAGATLARELVVETVGGSRRQTTELVRWDHAVTEMLPATPTPLADLLVRGVRAAVVAPERELTRWFSPPTSGGLVHELVAEKRLERPGPGWVSAPDTASARAPAAPAPSPTPA